MPGEIDHAAKTMMATPQGKKIIQVLDKYNSAMNSESGRQLMTMLSGSGSDALKSSARAALQAPREPGRALLQNLLSSKDGAALAAKIIEVMGG